MIMHACADVNLYYFASYACFIVALTGVVANLIWNNKPTNQLQTHNININLELNL